MELTDKYLGESKIPTINYEKVSASDWIIYDEGTGTIQKIVKGSKKAPSSQFVSSKSAAVRADYAVKNLSWMFLKKNKGFSKLVKTVKNNESYLIEGDHSTIKKTIKDVIRKLEKATDDSGDKSTIRGLENQGEKFLDGVTTLASKLKVKI